MPGKFSKQSIFAHSAGTRVDESRRITGRQDTKTWPSRADDRFLQSPLRAFLPVYHIGVLALLWIPSRVTSNSNRTVPIISLLPIIT